MAPEITLEYELHPVTGDTRYIPWTKHYTLEEWKSMTLLLSVCRNNSAAPPASLIT